MLLGAPGAGKGTQAVLLAERFAVPHVSTGDLLRAAITAGTEMGLLAKSYMDAGVLVPDDVILEMLRTHLSGEGASSGFVLDGFPRNESQASSLDAMLTAAGLELDAVILIDVSDDAVIERLAGRRSCPGCGRVYNLASNPPLDPRICDVDRTPLAHRDDDQLEVILRRLEVYRLKTAPLIQHYERRGLLRRIGGTETVEEVSERIVEAMRGGRMVIPST